jgi:hypothetical protein
MTAIPIRGQIDTETTWTLGMAGAEEAQLKTLVTTMCAPSGVTVTGLVVNNANKTIDVTCTFNGQQQTIPVPTWRKVNHLTPYPANYVADRVLDFLGLPGTP